MTLPPEIALSVTLRPPPVLSAGDEIVILVVFPRVCVEEASANVVLSALVISTLLASLESVDNPSSSTLSFIDALPKTVRCA